MRGLPFVLVPTLSLVNMGVNGASIGNMLGQRGDDAKLGATAHAARQYHTADFSNSDSGAHKGAVAHRALLDTLTQPTVLSSADTGSSAQSVSPRADVGQKEVAALSEDMQNVASVVSRQVSLDVPSLTKSVAPNTISSGNGLTSFTGVDNIRRATTVADKTAVCSKHKGSVDARALEITKTSASDPIDISNVGTGLALRAQHARQVPALPVPVPALIPIPSGLPIPPLPVARDVQTIGNIDGVPVVQSIVGTRKRSPDMVETFDGKPVIPEVNTGSTSKRGVGILPFTSGNPVSGVKVTAAPAAANPSASSLASDVVGMGSPLVVPSSQVVGGNTEDIVVDSPVSGSTPGGIPSGIAGLASNLPVSLSSAAIPPPDVSVSESANPVGSYWNFFQSLPNLFGGRVDTDAVRSDVNTANGFPNDLIEDNTARGLTDMLKSFPLSGATTVKRDANLIVDTSKKSATALFSRQEDTTSPSGDSDSGDAASTSDSADDGTGSTDAVTVSRRQTSDSANGAADSADDTDGTSDSTGSGDDSDSAEAAATATRRQTADESSTDATGDSTDTANSGDASDATDATTTTAARRQTTEDSSEATDSGDAAGDSTDSSGAEGLSDSSDGSAVTRRQSTDDDAAASDSTTGEAADSSNSDSSDADASASATRRQTADESTDTSDSSDASADSTDSADSGDISGSDSSDDTATAVTRRQTTDDSADASNSDDAAADSTADDSADASGSSDTSDDTSDANDSTSAAVERRQDTADDGSSAQGDDDASSATSADGDESTVADGSDDAASRRRALAFTFTPPSKLKNRMSMRKGKRQDDAEIADAIANAASGSDADDAAAAVEEGLDNLD